MNIRSRLVGPDAVAVQIRFHPLVFKKKRKTGFETAQMADFRFEKDQYDSPHYHFYPYESRFGDGSPLL